MSEGRVSERVLGEIAACVPHAMRGFSSLEVSMARELIAARATLAAQAEEVGLLRALDKAARAGSAEITHGVQRTYGGLTPKLDAFLIALGALAAHRASNKAGGEVIAGAVGGEPHPSGSAATPAPSPPAPAVPDPSRAVARSVHDRLDVRVPEGGGRKADVGEIQTVVREALAQARSDVALLVAHERQGEASTPDMDRWHAQRPAPAVPAVGAEERAAEIALDFMFPTQLGSFKDAIAAAIRAAEQAAEARVRAEWQKSIRAWEASLANAVAVHQEQEGYLRAAVTRLTAELAERNAELGRYMMALNTAHAELAEARKGRAAGGAEAEWQARMAMENAICAVMGHTDAGIGRCTKSQRFADTLVSWLAAREARQ